MENLSYSTVMLRHEVGFDSVEDGMNNLLGLIKKRIHGTKFGKDCCLSEMKTNVAARFCSKCGFRLQRGAPTIEDVIDFFDDNLHGCHEDNHTMYSFFLDNGWKLGEAYHAGQIAIVNAFEQWAHGEKYRSASVHSWEAVSEIP